MLEGHEMETGLCHSMTGKKHCQSSINCTARQCSPLNLWEKAKIYGVLYNQASSIAFDETFGYWSALKRS